MRGLGTQVTAILAELHQQAGASLDQFADIDRTDLSFTIRRLDVEVTTAQAVAASKADGVLIVDTLADLQDAYRDQAASVEVTGAPDALAAYMAFVLNTDFGPVVAPSESAR
jgi:hypothetical protein